METRRDWVKNSILYAMKSAAAQMYYSEDVMDHQRYGKQTYNILITACSTGGAIYVLINSLSEKFIVVEPWNTVVSILSIILVGVIALANQFSNVFFLKNEDYNKLCDLHTIYLSYLNKLEELYGWVNDESVTTDNLEKRLATLKDKYDCHLTEASRLFGKNKPSWSVRANNRYVSRLSNLDNEIKQKIES